MIKKDNLDKTNSWPFVEAKKILRERKSFIEKKNKIILQTGYGPSVRDLWSESWVQPPLGPASLKFHPPYG